MAYRRLSRLVNLISLITRTAWYTFAAVESSKLLAPFSYKMMKTTCVNQDLPSDAFIFSLEDMQGVELVSFELQS